MDIKEQAALVAESKKSLQDFSKEELDSFISGFGSLATDEEKKEILIKLLDNLSEDELKKENYKTFFQNETVLPYVKQLIEVTNS